ncbi:nuclear transport factor 2 family protein [Dyella acidiphila]|uniref:Nuclear transport factor 2 family protein n=1 Tax=Dyella acidiphila TaxID=2775866 RepID=A0ABR9GA82_9GAMM|nr:nuclear transport factor 2 family protein [Dyella acidiphila]MBE1160926.1 nuclear transport factor 2 family protein [Dyella acidiphila]
MSLSKKLSMVLLACMPATLLAQGCGKASDPVQVVQAQVEAYNAHDIDAFAACYADDVSIVDLSGKHPPIQGIAALKTTYAFLAKVPKAYRVAIVQRSVSGPVVVDHERVLGLPAGKGQPEAFAVYEVRQGKIQRVWFPPAQ